ncbi:hypothetical protein IL61_0213285 [Brucella ceti B1/94]|nr:hypothetical protein IL61_0213285 [Brucella ceti B1/94]
MMIQMGMTESQKMRFLPLLQRPNTRDMTAPRASVTACAFSMIWFSQLTHRGRYRLNGKLHRKMTTAIQRRLAWMLFA